MTDVLYVEYPQGKSQYAFLGSIYSHTLVYDSNHKFNTQAEPLVSMIRQFGPVRDLTLNSVIYALEGDFIVTAPNVTHTRWDIVMVFPLILTFASSDDAMLAKFLLTE